MTGKSLALGGAVVLLSGLAAWVGGHLAAPVPAEGPVPLDADVRTHLEEIERRLGYLEKRLESAEQTAADARDLAEALRDRPSRGGATPTPGAPGEGAVEPGPAGVPKSGATTGDAVPPDPTDEERHAARVRNIQDTLRREARTMVPAILRQLADTDPRAAETRRRDAMVAARQMAVALGVSGEEADRLHTLYTEQAERTAREVGPLVKDGLGRADVPAVERAFESAWADMDRQAKEILGDEKFARYAENAGSLRTLIREVLAENRR